MEQSDGQEQSKKLKKNGFTLVECLIALILLPVFLKVAVSVMFGITQVHERWLQRQADMEWHMLVLYLQTEKQAVKKIDLSAKTMKWQLENTETLTFTLKNDKLMLKATNGGNITLLHDIVSKDSYFEKKKTTIHWFLVKQGRGLYEIKT